MARLKIGAPLRHPATSPPGTPPAEIEHLSSVTVQDGTDEPTVSGTQEHRLETHPPSSGKRRACRRGAPISSRAMRASGAPGIPREGA